MILLNNVYSINTKNLIYYSKFAKDHFLIIKYVDYIRILKDQISVLC